MKCSDIRLFAERRAAGLPLQAEEENALALHTTECPACRAAVRFEDTLAATIRELPSVTPPPAFADMVLAALPEPVLLPEPSFRGLWASAAAGVAVAGVASWALWANSAQWAPWLSGAQGKAQLDSLLYQAYMSLGHVTFSTMSIVFVALIGLTAWGASALAVGER